MQTAESTTSFTKRNIKTQGIMIMIINDNDNDNQETEVIFMVIMALFVMVLFLDKVEEDFFTKLNS